MQCDSQGRTRVRSLQHSTRLQQRSSSCPVDADERATSWSCRPTFFFFFFFFLLYTLSIGQGRSKPNHAKQIQPKCERRCDTGSFQCVAKDRSKALSQQATACSPIANILWPPPLQAQL
jgi:hypothetical protein